MVTMNLVLLVIIAFSTNGSVVNAGEMDVPVLIWGTAIHYTPATALKSYSSLEFTDILTSYIRDDTIGVVLTEPQLTSEDISLCRTTNGITCFASIQKIPNKLYMASVENPLEILHEIDGGDDEKTKTNIFLTPEQLVMNDVGVKTITLQPGRFTFIHLPNVGNANQMKSTGLVQHAVFITQLTKILSAKYNKNLLIIYTTAIDHSHNNRPQHITNGGRYARDVGYSNFTNETDINSTSLPKNRVNNLIAASVTVKNDADHTNATIFQNEYFLIYYHQLLKYDDKANYIDVHMKSMNVLNIENGLQIDIIDDGPNKWSMKYVSTDGYWKLTDFEWNNNKLYSPLNIAAINGFSYHCTPAIQFDRVQVNLLQPTLSVFGLQIEGKLKIDNDAIWTPLVSFSESWDCVGFTSPAVLGGLFVTFMMLLILIVGIAWIMDINTMDRFDDPKGKTITISVNE